MVRWSPMLGGVLGGMLAATAVACGGIAADGGADGVTVLATTSIIGDVVSNVVGDEAEVGVIVPRGADPHGFAPSATQVAAMTDADLVVANGLGLEASLADTVASVEAGGTAVFEFAEAFTTLLAGHDGDDDGDNHDGDEDPAGADPHIWFDAPQMAAAVVELGDRLEAVAGSAGGEWAARARAYADEILATDRQVEQIVSAVPDAHRKLVTNHDTFTYFARRYGFEVVGTVLPGQGGTAQASAQRVAELIEVIDDTGVPAIFSEVTLSERVIRSIAREVGRPVEVVPLLTGSLAPDGEEGDTYLSMLLTNARRIADALA